MKRIQLILILSILIKGLLTAQKDTVFYNIATNYFDKAQYKKAIPYYSKALELNPNDTLSYYERGLSQLYIKKAEESLQDLNHYLSLKQNDTDAYYSRGVAKCLLKNYNAGILDFQKVLSINPRYSDAYNAIGNAKMDLDEFEEALRSFDRAIELNPLNPNTYFNRGLLFKKLGKKNAAKDDFKTAKMLQKRMRSNKEKNEYIQG